MIEMLLSGFLFLLILVLSLVMGSLGYLWEKDDYDSDSDLQRINKNPIKFKMGMVVSLIHNSCVIALPILLFIGFSSYNLILGFVWIIFRIGEGVILFSTEPSYWSFLSISRQYYSTNDSEKKSLSNLAYSIFKTKDIRFKFAMLFWSIGTIAFSIVLVIAETVPQIIGWLGIVAGIIIFLSNSIKIRKPNLKVPVITALVPILFEITIGGWLLVSQLL